MQKTSSARGARRGLTAAGSAATVHKLEPRVLLAAAGVPADSLAIPTDKLRHGRHDFADTWHSLDAVKKPSAKAVSYLHVNAFEPFSLNEANLRSTLTLAPMEFTAAAAEQPVEVSIPGPDGGPAQRFAVVETLVMDPKLAAKFPGIKTYRGQGIDDPTATARFDLTPQGFHAQVLSPLGAYYIDPYWHLNKSTYAAYSRNDVAGKPGERVALDNDIDLPPGDAGVADGSVESAAGAATSDAGRPSGTQLRTYRAAVAATGEYTAFFGGTVSAGQAAIVTAINRVNQIYETELAIRLSLVANNSSLVYTNANSDPYTNNNGSTMLGQNQNNLDTVIGNANYDIGHVFSTGGGGIATLRSVGSTSLKARGVTGLGSPVGDASVVDYVAHEIGHQFGGNHTFNTSKDPNRAASAAYEPGSGSTIMAYAGLEGSDDLQPHSDPFFAWKSFDEIIVFVDNTIPGVGTRTSTGNSVPTVNAGSDWTIPTNTPFALTATGSDANGDTLTYSWEQADLGAARLLTDPDNGASPLFRVYNPTTSPTRTFPKLLSILSGANATSASTSFPTSLAERLPTLARAMDFRVTVRDNRAGGSGVNTDDMVVNVVASGSGFLITSQNTGVSYTGGSSQAVTWDVSGTTANGINAASVNIRLSTDGGNTFPTLLATNVANDGSETVTIPNLATTQARIKVEPTNNVFFDINNANFTITAPLTQSATPGTPDLVAGTDTGTSSTDNITNRDNSTAAKNLQLSVTGTVTGATVSIYSSGTLIGTAVASGTTTTVTTNGSVDLADGGRSITARQTESGKSESADSSALGVTIDTVRPTADVVDVSPDPRTVGVSSVAVTFSEVVANVDVTDFSLTRSGGNIPLTASQSPTSADNINFSVPDLLSLTSVSGTYVLSVSFAPAQGITDPAGNILSATASDTWVHSLPTWLSASGTAASWNSQTKALTVTGAATIIADPAADTPAVSVSGASAVLTVNPTSDSVINLATLSLANGAVATVSNHGANPVRALVLNSNPTIDAGTKLDLTNNVLVVRNGTLSGIQSQVAATYAGGAWTGMSGIASSTAATDPTQGTAVGFASNASLNKTTFAGVTGLTSAAVIVKYTYAGDANLDGQVDIGDLGLLAGAWQQLTGKVWFDGDFTFDGAVNIGDLGLLAGNWQKGVGNPL